MAFGVGENPAPDAGAVGWCRLVGAAVETLGTCSNPFSGAALPVRVLLSLVGTPYPLAAGSPTRLPACLPACLPVCLFACAIISSMCLFPSQLCADMGVMPPIPVSSRLRDVSELWSRVIAASRSPHVGVPETSAARNSRELRRRRIYRSTVIAVGELLPTTRHAHCSHACMLELPCCWWPPLIHLIE